MDFTDFLSRESIFKHRQELSLYTTWFQLFATFTATLSIISCGFHFGWPSPSLPKLLSPDSPVLINKDEGSWLAVAPLFGGVIGSLTISLLVDKIGRKNVILFTIPVYTLSWITIYFADTFHLLLLGRIIAGIADGGGYVAIPMYVGEIADERIRGILGSFITIMLLFGQLIINIIGSFITVRQMAALALLVPLTQAVSFIFMPESPYYLLMKGNTDDARDSLQRLRNEDNVEKELRSMNMSIRRQMENSGNFIDLFRDKVNRRAICITMGLRAVQQGSGISFFTFYVQLIFEKAGNTISPVVSAIIFNALLLFLCFGSSLLLDRLGRKPLLICSSIGCMIMLSLNGAYFYVQHHADVPLLNNYWISLGAMLAYIVVYSLGLGVIPICMLGELFPANIKGKALAFMELYFSVFVVITTKIFQFLNDQIGTEMPFFLCAVCCVFGVLFACTCVPETKGKTLEEIQITLGGGKRADRLATVTLQEYEEKKRDVEASLLKPVEAGSEIK